MPVTLQDADMADLMAMTHRHEGCLKVQQIAQELQRYEIMGRWLKRDKMTLGSGRGIQRNLLAKLANSARHQGLLDEDQLNIVDLLAQIQVDWVLCSRNYGWLETDVLENRGREMILNIIRPRRIGSVIDMAQELEDKAFATPTLGDTVNPWGIPYWIVKNAIEGFNGGAASGFTTVAGLNLTTYPTYKNYTGTYGTISKSDGVRKMRKMHRKMNWVSPTDVPDYRSGRGDQYRYYTNEAVFDDWEMLLEVQNDNLGPDLAPMDGNTMVFRKHPLVYVPKLDADTDNPIYAIDHSTFFVAVLSGMYFKETGPIRAPKQHLAWAVFVDLRYNFINVDRRRSGVIYQA